MRGPFVRVRAARRPGRRSGDRSWRPAPAGRHDRWGRRAATPEAVRTAPRSARSVGERGNDLCSVGVDGGFLGVVHGVERELVDAQRPQLLQLVDVRLGRAEQAEAVDDGVGDEGGVGVAGRPWWA